MHWVLPNHCNGQSWRLIKGPVQKKHGDDYFDHLPAVNQRFWQGPNYMTFYLDLLDLLVRCQEKVTQNILSQMVVNFMVKIYHGITVLKKSPQKNKSKVTFWNICPAPRALTFPKQHWVSRPNQSSANVRVTLFGKASDESNGKGGYTPLGGANWNLHHQTTLTMYLLFTRVPSGINYLEDHTI